MPHEAPRPQIQGPGGSTVTPRDAPPAVDTRGSPAATALEKPQVFWNLPLQVAEASSPSSVSAAPMRGAETQQNRTSPVVHPQHSSEAQTPPPQLHRGPGATKQPQRQDGAPPAAPWQGRQREACGERGAERC